MGSPSTFANEFIKVTTESLCSRYWPKIKSCVESLSQADVEWRPPDDSVPSINAILHRLSEAVFRTLAAVEAEVLPPSAPMSSSPGRMKEKLIAEIDGELGELMGVLRALPLENLPARRVIGGREMTVMEVIMNLSQDLAASYGEISQLASVVSDYKPACEH